LLPNSVDPFDRVSIFIRKIDHKVQGAFLGLLRLQSAIQNYGERAKLDPHTG
jgi:hypothetical protein